MEDSTDPRKLIISAKNGDTVAFGKLYELYFTPVFRYIFARTAQRALAEDLAQTVFVKAFEHIDRYQSTAAPPLAYLFTIARNTIIDHWKKEKDILFQEEDVAIQAIPDGKPSLPHQSEIKEIGESLRGAILELPPDQQEVITLKFINDFTNKEIAELLGKSEDAIRQLQSRAIKTLRVFSQKNDIL